MPCLLIYFTPSCNPKIPEVLSVPASKRSGYSPGWTLSKVLTPLPPTLYRLISGSFNLTQSPPIPCGPYKLLCPVKHKTSTPSLSTSIGTTPAVCEASTTEIRLCFLQIATTFSKSTILPVTLELCVIAIIFVFGWIAFSKSA